MSPPLAVAKCPVKHCGAVHPTALVSPHGCPSCSIGAQQVAAYAKHRALILASPAYAEEVARREHAYYHPPEDAFRPADS